MYKSHTNDYIRQYNGLQDCLIDVVNIHPEINVTAGDWTTNCVLKTDTWTLHFKPTDSLKTSQGPRNLINQPVLSRQYSDDQIRHLDLYTELKTIPHIDMPKNKITFDLILFKIKLEVILNQTENDKKLFASVYRDPELIIINKIRHTNEYDVTSLLGMALATLSLIGIIYLLINKTN